MSLIHEAIRSTQSVVERHYATNNDNKHDTLKLTNNVLRSKVIQKNQRFGAEFDTDKNLLKFQIHSAVQTF